MNDSPQIRADFDAMDDPDTLNHDARFIAYAVISAAETLVTELRRPRGLAALVRRIVGRTHR